MQHKYQLKESEISQLVKAALDEDLANDKGDFVDVSSNFLPAKIAYAEVISRQRAMLCGRQFAAEVFSQISDAIKLNWQLEEGEMIKSNQVFLKIEGPIASILKAERTALNFLQLMSAIATKTKKLKDLIAPFPAQILDTRKTLPTLRSVQKYATSVGGAINHRFGLFDAILLKENHILAAGGIKNALHLAKQNNPDLECIIEVENLSEFTQALEIAKHGKPDRILIDNFSLAEIEQAVQLSRGICPVEVSGGIHQRNIAAIAQTGVDFISLGTLTKNIRATDLSLRVIE